MKKSRIIIISVIAIIIITTIIYYVSLKFYAEPLIEEEVIEEKLPEKYGEILDGWEIYIDTVRKGDYLGTIMNRYGITAQQIDKIAKMSHDTFNTTMINVGRPFVVFSDTVINDVPVAKIFIYENSRISYTKYDFRNSDTILVEKHEKHIDTVTNEASGIIKYSLWQTMIDNGYNWDLALALSQTFAWTVDFYSLQPGDWFKIVFDELYVEDIRVGLAGVKAGVFYHGGKELWAIPFKQDIAVCFFDTLGNSMRKTFLKAPLEYTRVSSRYSTSRMHPIFNQAREHLAVDFAAPMGTPIFAASDGTIVGRAYGTGAGYYITIRHNSVYTTVYMHLSKFGKYNIGEYVSQGDIIGYVGSTGWSTGPHLHYEIHENGRKIDPLSFEPPPAEPVDSANIERFQIEKRKWIDWVKNIELKSVVESDKE
ncbi:MAG: peptidoglycan DD-metalloendopeptidase family protein [Bacteroidales bacterium]|jgi:murein DD-endopeptidase MepM/ murein hydrolase activator NlpD|nr:peptidoglycan DD-metalloendopeptidase family protein [Bacteroidales bacterium]